MWARLQQARARSRALGVRLKEGSEPFAGVAIERLQHCQMRDYTWNRDSVLIDVSQLRTACCLLLLLYSCARVTSAAAAMHAIVSQPTQRRSRSRWQHLQRLWHAGGGAVADGASEGERVQ